MGQGKRGLSDKSLVIARLRLLASRRSLEMDKHPSGLQEGAEFLELEATDGLSNWFSAYLMSEGLAFDRSRWWVLAPAEEYPRL